MGGLSLCVPGEGARGVCKLAVLESASRICVLLSQLVPLALMPTVQEHSLVCR